MSNSTEYTLAPFRVASAISIYSRSSILIRGCLAGVSCTRNHHITDHTKPRTPAYNNHHITDHTKPRTPAYNNHQSTNCLCHQTVLETKQFKEVSCILIFFRKTKLLAGNTTLTREMCSRIDMQTLIGPHPGPSPSQKLEP